MAAEHRELQKIRTSVLAHRSVLVEIIRIKVDYRHSRASLFIFNVIEGSEPLQRICMTPAIVGWRVDRIRCHWRPIILIGTGVVLVCLFWFGSRYPQLFHKA